MKLNVSTMVVVIASVFPVTTLAADSRDFSLDVPAGEIRRLELDANVGRVEIIAADTKTIEIRATLEPDDDDWFGSSDRLKARLEAAELEHDITSGVLSLRLDYDDSHGGDDSLEEQWEIRMPASIALDTELNVGSMRLEGSSAGVVAEVNVGELYIEVLKGDVDAEVNVGELIIKTKTDSAGEFDLESNIGDVRLRIDGKSAGTSDGWLGRSIRHSDDGEDDVAGRVNVGEVRVDVR